MSPVIVNPFRFGAPAGPGIAQTAVGTITTTTGAINTTYVVSGLAFAPKAVIFFAGGATSASNSLGNPRVIMGIATSTSDRRCAGVFSQRSANPTNEAMHYRDDAVFYQHTQGAATTSGRLDVSAFASDGFTCIVDEVFGAGFQLGWMAIGGTGVTNAKTGAFNEPGSTGSLGVTGVGFQPTCVLLIGCGGTAAAPTFVDDSNISFGVATGSGSTEQFVLAGSGNDNVSPSVQRSYIKSGECVALCDAAATSIDFRASFTSFDSDGFTLNVTERASTRVVFYLALRGGSYTVGNTNAHVTLNGTTAISGLGYAPTGIAVWANRNAESTSDTLVSGTRHWSMGAGTAAATRWAHTASTADASAAANGQWGQRTSAVIQFNDFTPVVTGLTDISSMDVDGFTLITDDADGAYFIPYLAIG
jgi:hypothetical protein